MQETKTDPHTGLASNTFGIGTFEHGDRIFPALVRPAGELVDLSTQFSDTHQIFESWERNFDLLVDLDARASALDIPFSDARPLPPLARPNIMGAGANYRRHVVEMLTFGPYPHLRIQEGETEEEAIARNEKVVDERVRSGMPILWSGMHSSMIGARDDIMLPAVGARHDWELELTVVLGTVGRLVSVEKAGSLIAGYMIANDMATHDQFERNDVVWRFDFFVKNQPSFKPVGPFIVPAPFVDRETMRIRLELNGVKKQDWPVSDMLFSPEQIVAYASERARLMPGDMILTGSPPGNASTEGIWLKEGDVMTSSITGLGAMRHHCVQEALPADGLAFGAYPRAMEKALQPS